MSSKHKPKYIYFVVPSYSVFFYSDLQVCCNEPLFLFVLPYNPACAWFTTFFCNRYWILRIVFGTLTVFIDHFRQYLRIPVVMFHYLFVLNYFICLHFGYAIQDPPMLFASGMTYQFKAVFHVDSVSICHPLWYLSISFNPTKK